MLNTQAATNSHNRSRIDSSQNSSYQKNDKRGGGGFQLFNQSQQIQQIISLLLPLIQLLLNQLQSNNNCCQSNTLDLSDEELEKLNQALSSGGSTVATGVIDKDCNGKISIGDQVNTTHTNPVTHEVTNGTVSVDQGIIDKLTNPPTPPVDPEAPSNNQLNLTEQQRLDLEQQLFNVNDQSSGNLINRFTTTFTGDIIDVNGDGKISINDIAKVQWKQEFQNQTSDGLQVNTGIRDHRITLEDFQSLSTEQGRLTEVLTDFDSFLFSPLSTYATRGTSNYSAVDERLRTALPSSALNEAGQITGILDAGDVPYVSDIVDQNGDKKLSPGDTILIDVNRGQTVQHSLSQAEFDRFLTGEKYIDPALIDNDNPNLDATDLNTISGFLDETRRYGDIPVSIRLATPDDFPKIPEDSDEQVRQATKALSDALFNHLDDLGLPIAEENKHTFNFIPSVFLRAVNTEQLLAISNYTGTADIGDARGGARGANGQG